MTEQNRRFRYVAMDASGRRMTGVVEARSEALAFERLKRDGYSPVRITGVWSQTAHGAKTSAGVGSAGSLRDRETAELLADLAALLEAGADIRAALSILTGRAGRPAVARACKALTADISGGGALDEAFARRLPPRLLFVSALVAAGEVSGDLASALKRASEMLDARRRLKDEMVSVLSYPAFVFLSTIAAVGVILLFVVPSLAPLIESGGGPPPMPLGILIATSNLLRGNGSLIAVLAGAAGLAGAVAVRLGFLTELIERLFLDGFVRRTAAGITYGAFAIALGTMLSSGAPMGEALKLATRSVRSGVGRRRLEPVAQAVRQGAPLSGALEAAQGFPSAIVRLCAVGEATGATGAMLVRAGRLEEQAALRRIEQAGRLLGPILIVLLGGLVGVLMAGLLSGVSQLGESVAT